MNKRIAKKKWKALEGLGRVCWLIDLRAVRPGWVRYEVLRLRQWRRWRHNKPAASKRRWPPARPCLRTPR